MRVVRDGECGSTCPQADCLTHLWVGYRLQQREHSLLQKVVGLKNVGCTANSFLVVISSLQVADGPTDHEFRGQDALAEGHSWMMQALEKHLHAGFADLFFVDADG